MSLISMLTTPVAKAVEQSLNLRMQRHKLLVGNLANLNTPGYKAADLDFEGALKQAIGQGNEIPMMATHSRHLGFGRSLDRAISARMVASPTPSGQGDGNSVDIDYQMSRLMQNQLLYVANAQIMRRIFSGLSETIEQAGASG